MVATMVAVGVRGRALGVMLAVAGTALGLSGCDSSQLGSFTGSTALFASGPRAQSDEVPLFVASTRKGEKGAAANQNLAEGDMNFSLAMISVPPNHHAGVIERATFGADNPASDFAMVRRHTLDTEEFQNELATNISGRVGTNRDVLVFVHGFNTGLDEARYRAVQLVTDGRFGGVPVLFTWPSGSGLLAYGSDKERATASRDALEKLLWTIAQTPGVGRVHVLAHSMGTWLAMEALRQNAIAGHGDLGGHLGEVMLAAPDIDLEVFKGQMVRIGQNAHVSVFTASNDRALSLSSALAGSRARVGALDLNNPGVRDEMSKMGVRVYDLTDAADGFIHHGAYADTPAVLRQIGAQLATPGAQSQQSMAVLDGDGKESGPIDQQPVPAAQPAAAQPAQTPAAQPTAAQPAQQQSDVPTL
ncbi:alpha/beta hydrolase [Methylovirgula sp. 4M-Z18]|uniref:alpha/beta hydrolase n=1 Tax=Methylovirgula sp. 4M-Z18 TaxID=2293567 RepID=UPI000E2FAB7F|nr:alpha/beta fold hydrolase [Methylovirgula sp. 4M-Z18]RFB81328.1 alpha/beta fold hydrolase [Methylovirgula sp. 4M-Z18]